MNTAEEFLEWWMRKEHGIVNFPEKETIIKAMNDYATMVAKNISAKPLVMPSLLPRCSNEDAIYKGFMTKCGNQNICELCRQQ